MVGKSPGVEHVADNIDKLVAILAESEIDATREQAERLAIRVSGSVDGYIAYLERTSAELKDYAPLPEPEEGVSGKFSDPLAYEIEPGLTQARMPREAGSTRGSHRGR